jgi:alkylation response protein AidB-like acyl-CoA dehydrogenase
VDFEYTDEQRLLAESLERFVSDRYDFETRHKALTSAEGWDCSVWQELAEMGLLALPFSEEDGGFGGSGVDMMIVMQAMGKCLSLEPYFATAVLAGGAPSKRPHAYRP